MSSSIGVGEDDIDVVFFSFFPDISREGVEVRTKWSKNAKQNKKRINHGERQSLKIAIFGTETRAKLSSVKQIRGTLGKQSK